MASSEHQLETWRAHIPRDVDRLTQNMKNWQKGWTQHCSDLCCYSSECGTIRCDGCKRSVTNTVPSGHRYVCMGCPLPEKKSSSNRGDHWEEAAYTLCESCFAKPDAVSHPHAPFCHVDRKGEHALVTRATAEERTLTIEDFVAYTSVLDASEFAGQSCVVCWAVDFDEETRPTIPFGCRTGLHPFAAIGADGEVAKSTQGYICRECEFQTAKSAGQLVFCGDNRPLLCAICSHEDELRAWKAEFTADFAQLEPLLSRQPVNAADAHIEFARLATVIQLPALPENLDLPEYDGHDLAELLGQLLCRLHRQPWLQKLINEAKDEFSAMTSDIEITYRREKPTSK